MTTISKEEYGVLKVLDGMYKWMARDGSGELYIYEGKPKKFVVEWVSERDYYLYLGNETFQFTQWEDEEPYSIAELLEEYESEEAEVKKDIEWLKEEIGELPCVDTVFNNGGSSYIDSAVPVMAVYDLLDQLDNQEVLSQEWIDKHKMYCLHSMQNGYFIPEELLQNLLVPKQEEIDRAYINGYEKGKEHATRDDEPETVASVMEDFLGAAERLKEVLTMEVKELEE